MRYLIFAYNFAFRAKLIFFTLLLLIVSPTISSSVPTVGANVNVTNNSYNQNEPMVAINPTNHNKLIVGYNDYRVNNTTRVGWSWSDNGGTAWTFGGTVLIQGYSYCGDPIVAFDTTGTAYLAGMCWNNPGNASDGSIFLAKSNDGGHTFMVFQKVVSAGSGTGNYLDKPWLYVNPANNDVYLAWTKRVNAFGVGGTEATTIWFTRSTDGGTTFSAPIQVSTFSPATGTNRSHGAQITALSASKVYVSWHTIESAGINPCAAGWIPPKIWIAESTNGGANFGTNNLVVSGTCNYPTRFISMDADPLNGRIYIAYADRLAWPTPNDYDVYVVKSTSAPGPWTKVKVSDAPAGDQNWQIWPTLDVAPNGRVDVIWYDKRDDLAGGKYHVYYSASTDGGATWETNTKVTNVNFAWPSVFEGDYLTIASVNNKAQAAWMDNRLATLPEIYTATITPSCVDNDADGYGNPGNASCPNGSATDCNDNDSSVNPGATEGPAGSPTCTDGKDNDCDYLIDAGDPGCAPLANPDLTVISIVTNPVTPAPNQTVNVTVTVKNLGSASAGVFYVDFYKHKDTAPGAYLVGDFACYKTGLAAGATDTCTGTINYAATGSYKMWAQVDTDQQVTESNESNNVFGPQSISVLPTDWIFNPATGSSYKVVDCGTWTNCKTMATNLGAKLVTINTAAEQNWLVATFGGSERFWIGFTDSAAEGVWKWTNGETPGYTNWAPSQPDNAWSCGEDYAVMNWASPGNWNDLGPCDYAGVSKAIIEKSCIDLIVSSLSTTPTAAYPGAVISIADTTKNIGTCTAPATITKLYLSTNTTLDAGDTYLGQRAVPSLGAAATSTGSTSVTIPSTTAIATYYIIAKADADEVFTEVNNTNNKKNKSIKIGPDLIVSSITINPTSPHAGQSITVTVKVKNTGGSAAGFFYIDIYKNRATAPPNPDTYGGDTWCSITGLAAGATTTCSKTVSYTPAGAYKMWALADTFNQAAEANETNNTKSKSITVVP